MKTEAGKSSRFVNQSQLDGDDGDSGDKLAAVATTRFDHAFPPKPQRSGRLRSNVSSGSLGDLTNGKKSI
jgi:hypothetical protein